jgi:phytol kinase
MTVSDYLSVAAVLCAVVLMLVLLRLGKRFMPVSPEQLRKIVHVGTGALAITFPWIFSSRTPVFLVCGLSLILLLGIKYYAPLRKSLSGVLDGVARESRGDIYFPASVAILFALARGNRLLYVIPILVLTFADTVAALLGEQYGRHGYGGMTGNKSMEGSVAFFTVAFLAVHVPLLLFTQLGRPETLLIALDIGLIVTLLEAIAWRGLDNVFIPLGVFILLHIYTAMPVSPLLARFVTAFILIVFVALYRSRTTLQGSALLASVLVLYASWAIGDWRWLIAPATLFVTYTLFSPKKLSWEDRTHNVLSVVSVSSTGLVWLFLAQAKRGPALLLPYTLGYAIHLSLLGWTFRVIRDPRRQAWKFGPLIVVESWLLLFVPYLLLQREAWRTSVWESLAVLPICGLAFAIFCVTEPRTEGLYSVGAMRWLRQAAIALLITALAAGASSFP